MEQAQLSFRFDGELDAKGILKTGAPSPSPRESIWKTSELALHDRMDEYAAEQYALLGKIHPAICRTLTHFGVSSSNWIGEYRAQAKRLGIRGGKKFASLRRRGFQAKPNRGSQSF